MEDEIKGRRREGEVAGERRGCGKEEREGGGEPFQQDPLSYKEIE